MWKIIILLLLVLNLSANVYNIKLIKRDGTVLYSSDGGITWHTYKNITEKYYIQADEISIMKDIDEEVIETKFMDYNGRKYDDNLITFGNNQIDIRLPEQNVFVIQVNFKEIHYTFLINNIR